MDCVDTNPTDSARDSGASATHIAQISTALARIDDPVITNTIGQLTERIAVLMERLRSGRTIYYVPPLHELLNDEPHGVPFCR